MHKFSFRLLATLFLFLNLTGLLYGQDDRFDVDLIVDYSAAQQCIRLFEDEFVNTEEIASMRGNLIAASTTGFIASKGKNVYNLRNYLDSMNHRFFIHDDVYRLREAKNNVVEIKELLGELQKRSFSRRVIATVAQIFPQDIDVTARIPVYIVTLGHQNVDAYVRRIIWQNDTPYFVGENEGELTIVVNIAQTIRYSPNLEDRFVELLGVVAHEVFHAAFGVYKDESPTWKRYYRNHTQPIDALLDLTQNEGIAYYLSMDQQWGDNIPGDWHSRVRETFITFNKNTLELLDPETPNSRISELIRTANLSGFWESYGAMAGMFIARTIDKQMGRAALKETISNGPADFFQKYVTLSEHDASLPKLKPKLIETILK